MFNRDLLSNPQAYYSQFFALKGNKAKHLVLCCFHHDKEPSLSLDLTTGRFNCFGCGASGGDIVDFHQLKYDLNFKEAAKDLGAWVDTSTDTPEQLAARKAKIEQANKEYKARQAQAAKAEKEHAQAFTPLVSAILKQCTKPMLEPPYCVAKSINSHNLTTITATDIQRFTLPKDPSEPTAKAITVCYGFESILTVAILETLEGKPVALQVFDGVPNAKGKYARWIIGKPVVMGAYYRLGDFTAPSVVLITEGIADAISCYEATGYPCLAAISKSQLANAAQAVKNKYPQALIVMCGDNDADGGGQQAAIAAAKAVNGVVVIPSGFKDFNDLHQAQGLEVVKMTIDAAMESKKAVPPSEDGTAPLENDLATKIIENEKTKSIIKPMLNVVTVGELVQMAIPPRENLLTPWLPMQGLAMVYAPRGIGKTFFALNVAYAVASGGEFLCWQAMQAQPVLYIDGEMPVISMKERLIDVISMHESVATMDALRIITPDLQQDYMMPDLATLEGQQALEPYLQGIKLIVVDNISTLCRSGRENESEGWITVQEWALRQRSAGRSVLFVHHAGKGGNQRGTSKREDVLDTVINLKRPIDYEPSHGASFEIHFEKTRGFSGEDAEPLSCQLGHDQRGNPAWLYSRLEDSTFDKVVNLINEGLSQAEIASELDINKSNVSRHVKKARLQGLIKDDKKQAKTVNSANYSKIKDGE